MKGAKSWIINNSHNLSALKTSLRTQYSKSLTIPITFSCSESGSPLNYSHVWKWDMQKLIYCITVLKNSLNLACFNFFTKIRFARPVDVTRKKIGAFGADKPCVCYLISITWKYSSRTKNPYNILTQNNPYNHSKTKTPSKKQNYNSSTITITLP